MSPFHPSSTIGEQIPQCCIYSPIASETLKCFEEAICSKDHARGPEVLAAWSTQSRTKVPRRGTFTAKQLVSSWLKFLCEALGRSSLRTKLRASSMHLHGLTNKIGSSTRSASSMQRGVRGDFLNRRTVTLIHHIISNPMPMRKNLKPC